MTTDPDHGPPEPAAHDRRKAAIAVLGIVAVLVLGGFLLARAVGSGGTGEDWVGTPLGTLAPVPDVGLVDTEGQPISLGDPEGDRPTVVFFGFTNCPDVCPISMATLADALGRAGADARVVFVTTDPERDDPEVLRGWLDAFDPRFEGATGTLDQLDEAQRAFAITPATREPAVDGDYDVAHYTGAFLVAPDGRPRLLYGFGTSADDWARDLARAEAGDWPSST